MWITGWLLQVKAVYFWKIGVRSILSTSHRQHKQPITSLIPGVTWTEGCFVPRSDVSLKAPQPPQTSPLIIPLPRVVIYNQPVSAFYSIPQVRKVPGVIMTVVVANPPCFTAGSSKHKKILDAALIHKEKCMFLCIEQGWPTFERNVIGWKRLVCVCLFLLCERPPMLLSEVEWSAATWREDGMKN